MGIGKQNNSKCNQEEGFGIFGTADEKSQFWKGKNLHVYIYIYIHIWELHKACFTLGT